MRRSTALCLSALILGFATSAHAIPMVGDLSIDFRSDSWAAAENNFGAVSFDGVTVEAFSNGVSARAKLRHNPGGESIGLGINTKRALDEPTEIDNTLIGCGFFCITLGQEVLEVRFDASTALAGAWVTELFTDEVKDLDEFGALVYDTGGGTTQIDFVADNMDGTHFVDLGGISAVAVDFFVPLDALGSVLISDFGVAGFVTAPEPAPTSLLGVGLLAFITVTTRRKPQY